MKSGFNRRDFLKASGLGVMSFAMQGCGQQNANGSARKQGKSPNVLIIHVDEHRIDAIGAYGNKQIKTPNIDALAKNGVLYKNSFCCYPVCTPSRYSLLSGMYVHDHGGWSNRGGLSAQISTFPKILRSAGYETKAVGKMHFTPTYLDVGFDKLVLSEQDGPGRWDDDYHRYLRDNNLVDYNDLEDQRSEYRKQAPKEYLQSLGAMTSNLSEEHHNTTWVGDRAIETLEKWESSVPSLLMVGFVKPHHPFDPPAPWDKMYDPSLTEIMPGWTEECFEHDIALSSGYFKHKSLNKKALKKATAYYYATISQIDFHVGRMIKILKNKDLYDNTMIVFTSDHGDYMGFHHMLLKGCYMYDPLAKVPLIIKWPGSAQAGKVNTKLVNNIDLAPTICKAAKLEPADTMTGLDLTDQGASHKIIFAESHGGRQVMARTDRYKLLLASPRSADLLFDLKNDPLEKTNLYDDPEYKTVRDSLLAKLSEWRHKGPKQKVLSEGPTINQPNVPKDLSHRKEMIEYYKDKMNSETQTK